MTSELGALVLFSRALDRQRIESQPRNTQPAIEILLGVIQWCRTLLRQYIQYIKYISLLLVSFVGIGDRI
jgi:hypothetical protein